MENKPIAVDLFAGCGGLSLGFESAGFNVVFSNDFWKPAATTYKANFQKVVFSEDDVKVLDKEKIETILQSKGLKIDQIDVVMGGPPCQGFSRLNNLKLDSKDPRNSLFREFVRLVSIIKPKFVLMENVFDLSNRKTAEGQYVKEIIVEEFKKIGYNVIYKVLNAADYGVPQKRRRIFFLGTRLENVKLSLPEQTHSRYSQLSLDGRLMEKHIPIEKVLAGVDEKLPNMNINGVDERIKEIMSHVPPGGYHAHIPHEIKVKFGLSTEARFGTYYRRLDNAEPSLTITDNPFIHPTENRWLTIREKARIQTFPDSFVFQGTASEQSQQLANAVPPLLAQKLATHLLKFLDMSKN